MKKNKQIVSKNPYFTKRIIVLGILGVFTLAMVLSYSLALFRRQYETNNVDFIVGDLNYKMESTYLDANKQITLAPGTKKQLNITLSSLNDIPSKYALYYSFVTTLTETEKNQVKVGYLNSTLHPTSGVIDEKESIVITVRIENNTSKSVTLRFGTEGGLENNTLEITKGYAIDQSMMGSDIILAATLDGTPLENFPTQSDNYGVESVACSDNAVGTFKTNNWSFVVENFSKGETECNVNFSKNLTIGQTDPIITTTKEDMNKEIKDGKSSIATAITKKGVTTSNTDSFATMAQNIDKIASAPGVSTIANGATITKKGYVIAVGSVIVQTRTDSADPRPFRCYITKGSTILKDSGTLSCPRSGGINYTSVSAFVEVNPGDVVTINYTQDSWGISPLKQYFNLYFVE